jgi:cellulose biosynthesis protein BcsE
MNDATAPLNAFVRLGVRGLPNLTDNMFHGGLYVLLAETTSVRFPILAESLANALNDGFPCTIVVPSHPDAFLQRVEASGSLNSTELIAADRLQVFVMQEEFPKTMFRFGAKAFVAELELFGIPEDSYILFDQADDVLSLHDITLAMDQINVLGGWLKSHRVTALLVFSRVTGANLSTINALMDSMNGVVRLGGDEEGLKLTFDYWQSPEGTIAARSYRLSLQDSGLYRAVMHAEQAAVVGQTQEIAQVEDPQVLYFYMNPDLVSLAKQMPGEWKLVDTFVGMLHATRNTRSSTSILLYQRDTNLRQLAETVHTLRTSLGRHAKIIVQEKNASLRYQNEAFLLKLGLNLIVHRDVPASRFPLMLEATSKQVFAKDIDVNFEAALASVLPTTASGYLTPSRFIREVQIIMDRGVTLDIPCAMVVGKPTSTTSVLEILKTSALSRPGDLITSDGISCFVFLNACPESVILKALVRVFQIPVESAIEEVQFLVRNVDIQVELSALGHNLEAPDYTLEVGGEAVPSEIADSDTSDALQVESTGVFLQETAQIFVEDQLRGPPVEVPAPERMVWAARSVQQSNESDRYASADSGVGVVFADAPVEPIELNESVVVHKAIPTGAGHDVSGIEKAPALKTPEIAVNPVIQSPIGVTPFNSEVRLPTKIGIQYAARAKRSKSTRATTEH